MADSTQASLVTTEESIGVVKIVPLLFLTDVHVTECLEDDLTISGKCRSVCLHVCLSVCV